jgi:hypothetical protein
MNRLKIVVMVVLLVALGSAQTRILLFDFEARGSIDASLVRISAQLLEDALNATYKYTVLRPGPGARTYAVLPAAESARAAGATQALIGSLMQIGTKRYISYQLVDAASGNVALADRGEIPPVEELPSLTERIAKSISELKPFSSTVEPENVTKPEVEPGIKNPRKPYSSIFLTAGYQYYPGRKRTFMATGDTVLTTMQQNLVNLNAAVSFETRELLTMLQLGFMRGVYEEKDLNFDLMVNRIFGNGDFAPFAGGGVGITRYTWQDPKLPSRICRNDGMTFSGGVGMLGLRTYYFRLLASVYGTYTLSSSANHAWGGVPGIRANFGVTTPTLGPDATVKMPPAFVGGAIGAMFLTGLIIALTS